MGGLGCPQVLMQMVSNPDHPWHFGGATALLATMWSSRAEQLELRMVGAMFLALLGMVRSHLHRATTLYGQSAESRNLNKGRR